MALRYYDPRARLPYVTYAPWQDEEKTPILAWLEAQCQQAGMTMRDLHRALAQQGGMGAQASYSTVYQWFRYKSIPSRAYIAGLALVFGVTVAEVASACLGSLGQRQDSRLAYAAGWGTSVPAAPAPRYASPPPQGRRGGLPPATRTSEQQATLGQQMLLSLSEAVAALPEYRAGDASLRFVHEALRQIARTGALYSDSEGGAANRVVPAEQEVGEVVDQPAAVEEVR